MISESSRLSRQFGILFLHWHSLGRVGTSADDAALGFSLGNLVFSSYFYHNFLVIIQVSIPYQIFLEPQIFSSIYRSQFIKKNPILKKNLFLRSSLPIVFIPALSNPLQRPYPSSSQNYYMILSFPQDKNQHIVSFLVSSSIHFEFLPLISIIKVLTVFNPLLLVGNN